MFPSYLRVAAACGLLAAVLAMASSGQEPEDHPGERLPASALGRSVIETLEAMSARSLPEPSGGRLRGASYLQRPGTWFVPSARATWTAHSGRRYAINQHGDPRMAIGFPAPADVEGAWFAPQGDEGAWARSVRLRGYRGGVEVGLSAELSLVSRAPVYLASCFEGVDRIVIEAQGAPGRPAYFALDDLSFRLGGASTILDFEAVSQKTDLTGTRYGGLSWEIGTGFLAAEVRAVPPPHEPASSSDPVAVTPQSTREAVTSFAPIVARQIDGPRIFEPGNAAIPPDTNGAAGPTHYVALVNGSFSIYDRASGLRTHQITIVNFWNVSTGLGDVRIVYDPHAQRFVALCMNGADRIYLAISLTSDPTGAWFKTSILASQGADVGRWPDFPTLGVDANGIYTAALMVGNGDPITLWAIDKAPLLQSPPQLGAVTAFRGLPWEGAVQPCLSYGAPGAEYLVSVASPTQLRLRRVVPPLTAPVLRASGLITIPAHGRAPSAPALGSITGIATGDWRPSNAVFRNGRLYTTQTIDVGGRAAVRWYEIDVAARALVQHGTIEDPLWHYYHGSIAANINGDLVVGFSGSHASTYVSAFVTGRVTSEPLGSMAPPILYRSGRASYERVDGNGTNRFGDYSLTGVDPVDDESFWTIQEYVPARDDWGTAIAHVRFSCARAEPYGSGLAGTLGIPTLSTPAAPSLGRLFALFFSNSRGAATPGALIFGTQQASLPIFGGTLLVQPPGVVIGIGLPLGQAILPFAIPSDPTLLCVPFYAQGLVVDPGAAQGIAMTRGLELVVGE
ncbi:MAG: hypothetical protein IPN34_20105 [Planctomycetes bacterium]|nr:hypothetical protein [Planctomycetota bacterium]